MDKRKISDEQTMAMTKGLLKAIIVWPSCWLAEHGVGTKLWQFAQFVRANHALMDIWNGYTDFGNKPKDDIQEDDWVKIERLQRDINVIADAIQNTSSDVFRFKEE